MYSTLVKARGYIVKRPSVLVASLGLIGLIIVCLTVIIGLHRDTSSYVSTVSPIIVTLLGLFVISRQVDDVRDTNKDTADKVETIETNTNGRLDARFQKLHEHIEQIANRDGDVG